MSVPFGGPCEIPLIHEGCLMDAFENHICIIGVVAACEWFGHSGDSEFTKNTIELLRERSAEDEEYGME